MKILLTVLCAVFICTNPNFGLMLELDENDFSSDDTVAVEALSNEAEADIPTTTVQPEEQARQEEEAGKYCVTKSGLSGNCESIRSCFPRLFPVDDTYDDTPKNSGGVYNQNLAKILIESSGFCGDSRSAEGDIDLSNLGRSSVTICCATSKVAPGDFQLENDTASVDSEFLKKPCGQLKIDRSNLPPEPERIVGGRPAVLGEYPWMVGMLRKGQQFCGASLLDSRNVITAAHCVEFMTQKDVADLRLHVGDLKIYDPSETNHVERKAKRILYHKGFTMKNIEHDIAIIHLNKPVTFSKTIQPVCLHPGNPAYDTGNVNGDVTGWGTTSSGGSLSPNLLTVTIPVITNKECGEKYSKAGKKIGNGMVCAGMQGKDSCQGDSGGPLVVDPRGQGKQIGIVSWGIGCATYPGVYTRVDKYMKWINKNKQ